MVYKKFYRDWDELPLLLTLGQCALLFGKSYETIRTWVKKGILPATQFGGEYRVAKADVKAMFERGEINV
jgi:excisionase family DNA binding protein